MRFQPKFNNFNYLNKFNYFNKAKKIFIFILFTASLLLSFQNCGNKFTPSESPAEVVVSDSLQNNDSTTITEGSNVSDQKGVGVLNKRCASCHNPQNAQGDISNITDINYLLYYRLVIPGQPEISDIMQSIKGGSMPPDGQITSDEVAELSEWILNGLTSTGAKND
jgi:hypothetical protein